MGKPVNSFDSNCARLAGKVAVVTGASTGIGRAVARLFALHGARVVLNYRTSRLDTESLADEIHRSGGTAVIAQADVSRPDDISKLVEAAKNVYGRIDIWANIAGADILTGTGATLPDRGKLARLIATDLLGTIECCWQIVPVMQAQGSGVILNMSWDLAQHGMEGRNPEMFAAIKSGIAAYSKCLARSVAPTIRVNCLAPGWIETEFAQESMRPEAYKAVVDETPLRRFGTPEDVAWAALFLVSDEAAFITGQVFNINGGLVS